MYIVMGYNTDSMSLKYALHLTAFERQGLHRIAKGRCGRRHPAGWKMERARALLLCDEGPEGWTDEAVAAALDVSAHSVSRRCQAVETGRPRRWSASPRSSRLDGAGEAQLLQRAQSTPPAGQARGTLRALARERVARGIASRIRYEMVRRVLKKTNCGTIRRCRRRRTS